MGKIIDLDKKNDLWNDNCTEVKLCTPRDVNFQEKDIYNIAKASLDKIQFDLTLTGEAPEEGKLYWDDTNGTLSLGMKGGNVNLQIGQETLIRVKNTQGTQIDNGEAVYISGGSGINPEVMLANASEQNGVQTIAIATEDITDQQFGYVTTFGLVRDINTSSFNAGDKIYLDATDGALTHNKLNHPNFRVPIGYCLRSSVTEGIIFVNINADQWLKRFQAMKEPTGFDADQSTLRGDMSFVNGTRTFTIEPQSEEDYFNFWISGQEFRKTSSETIVISDVEGLHYIYFDSAGDIQEAVNPSNATIDTIIRSYTLVSIIYWDATNNEYVWFNDERHLNQMDGSTHANLHFTRGTQWLSGGALGDFVIDDTGADNEDAQFSYASGIIADEDIISTESNIASTVGLEILYLSNGNWRRITESGFSVLTDTTVGVGATGRLVYNDVSTPGSEVLSTVGNNNFVLCHVLQTNGYTAGEKVFAVVGQNTYGNIFAAREGAITEVNNLISEGLPGAEFIFLGSIIFQTSDSYTNSVKARTRTTDLGDNYVDWRTTELSPASPGTNHSALSGLSNDDHVQYALLNGRSGGQTVYGGTDSGDDIYIESTSNATKGYVLLNSGGGNIGIGTNSPEGHVHIYDAVGVSAGALRIQAETGEATIGFGAGNASWDSARKAYISFEGWTLGESKLGIGGTTPSMVVDVSNGNVGIGTNSPATSAVLDITSTTGALLVPRMTTTQRDALTAVNGMIVYNTTTNAFNFYENSGWTIK